MFHFYGIIVFLWHTFCRIIITFWLCILQAMQVHTGRQPDVVLLAKEMGSFEVIDMPSTEATDTKVGVTYILVEL